MNDDDLSTMQQMMQSPVRAARLLAFLMYPRDSIVEALQERHHLSAEVAADIADDQIEQQRKQDANEERQVERTERAVAAEHDLSRTTWKEG